MILFSVKSMHSSLLVGLHDMCDTSPYTEGKANEREAQRCKANNLKRTHVHIFKHHLSSLVTFITKSPTDLGSKTHTSKSALHLAIYTQEFIPKVIYLRSPRKFTLEQRVSSCFQVRIFKSENLVCCSSPGKYLGLTNEVTEQPAFHPHRNIWISICIVDICLFLLPCIYTQKR